MQKITFIIIFLSSVNASAIGPSKTQEKPKSWTMKWAERHVPYVALANICREVNQKGIKAYMYDKIINAFVVR